MSDSLVWHAAIALVKVQFIALRSLETNNYRLKLAVVGTFQRPKLLCLKQQHLKQL